jgi:hypothetical protein
MSANSRAAALSNGNTRPARSSAKISSTTDTRDRTRLPSGRGRCRRAAPTR